MKLNWEKLLSKETIKTRKREEENPLFDKRNYFEQDYGRIIFSPSFRRLQDKAQVFPLETNDFVRTRLTHSLEVSTIARSIGIDLKDFIKEKSCTTDSDDDIYEYIPTILASAGLMHDLGNTPFGHSGERTIQSVFKTFFEKNTDIISEERQNDFINFDGNPQTFRIVTFLESIKDLYGLNLSYAALAVSMKYPVNSFIGNQKNSSNICYKKFGYFKSEEELALKILKETGLLDNNNNISRHPLTFLLEAADDIAYSIGDIEDGVKKGIFTIKDILNKIEKYISEEKLQKIKESIEKSYVEENAIIYLRVYIQEKMIEDVVNEFKKNYDDIMNGNYNEELLSNSDSGKLRKKLKNMLYELILSEHQIVHTEISGEKALKFLTNLFLKEFSKEEFARDVFNKLIHSQNQLDVKNNLYKLISRSYKKIYEIKLKNIIGNKDFSSVKNDIYYYSFLLITDYISGMTDSYSINLYRKLNAIDIY